MDADLDTLLIALYVELEDRIIPAHRPTRRRGPGPPPALTDAELVCLAVAQVLLRYYDERYWLRAVRIRVGHLFPRLLTQSEYHQRLKQLAPLMEAALRWLAQHTPGSGGRVPAGLWTRIVQRLLALNTAIWHNWNIGAPVKRSLIAYDH